jgi:hypothetical protein
VAAQEAAHLAVEVHLAAVAHLVVDLAEQALLAVVLHHSFGGDFTI